MLTATQLSRYSAYFNFYFKKLDMYTLLYLKRITNKDLLCGAGSSAHAAWQSARPGRNTCMRVAESPAVRLDPHNVVDPPSSLCSCSVASASLRRRGLQPTRLFRPWDFPGENTEAGCHFLIQGIFPTQTQGWNSCLLHCRWILCHCTTWEAPNTAYVGRKKMYRSQPNII